jgi:hypothetical protein
VDIKIVEANNEKMTIRVGIFYIFVDHLIVFLPLLIAIAVTVISIANRAFGILLIVPILIIWSFLSAFYLGRSLNMITIDREAGEIRSKKIGPWFPGRKSTYNIKSVTTLDFIFTGHSTPFSNYLILLLDKEEQLLNDRWKPLSCKIVLHERWWWLLSDENIVVKHMRIAEYLGVQYRKRLYSERGWQNETYVRDQGI